MDIALYDRQISAIRNDLEKITQDRLECAKNIDLCESEKKGLFKVYSCRNNTGRTLADWRDAKALANKEINRLTSELNRLTKERTTAQAAIDASLRLRGEEAEVELLESEASIEAGKKYGLWAAIIGAVGVFGYIVVKKIRS
jgi:hypothetical protein